MKLQTQIIAGFFLAVLILLAAGLVSYRSVATLDETADRVTRTHQTLEKLEELLRLMLDVQSAQRGYVITGKETYLEPYRAAAGRLGQALAGLRQLTADNPNQQPRLDSLEQLISLRLSFAEEFIQTRKSRGFDAAAEAIQGDQGKQLTDAIRTLVQEMSNEERTLHEERSRRDAQQGRRALFLVLSSSLLATAVVGLACWLILRGSSEQQRSQQELDRFFTVSLDMLCIAGFDGYLKRVNPAWEKALGYTSEELLARPYLEFVHPEDREATRAEAEKQAWGNTTLAFENRLQCKDGSYRRLLWNAKPIPRQQFVYAVARDITDRHVAENRLREAHDKLTRSMAELAQRTLDITRLSEMGELLQSCQNPAEASQVVANHLPKLFFFTAGALYVTDASRSLLEITATWGNAFPGERVFPPDDCWALRRGKLHWTGEGDTTQRCAHLSPQAASVSVCVPLMAQGEALGILHLQALQQNPASPPLLRNDSTQRLAVAVADQVGLALANLRLRETLRQQSIRDPLTGLFNRRFLEEFLNREVRRAVRSTRPLAVIMMDLDHFKRFNDTFGHDAGDLLLREIGRVLQSQVRDSDIACRYGGEEFALILPDTTLDTGCQRAERIREAAHGLNLQHAGWSLGKVALSAGVAVYPENGSDPATLLRAADQALYRAKHEGRDRVVLAEGRSEALPSAPPTE